MLILSFLPNTLISLFHYNDNSIKNYQYSEIKEKNETNEINSDISTKVNITKGTNFIKNEYKDTKHSIICFFNKNKFISKIQIFIN